MCALNVTYEGPVEGAYDLVDELRAAGLAVDWVPPPEERATVPEAVAIAIVARGSYDVLMLVLRRMAKRFGKKATISAEEEGGGQQLQVKPDQ